MPTSSRAATLPPLASTHLSFPTSSYFRPPLLPPSLMQMSYALAAMPLTPRTKALSSSRLSKALTRLSLKAILTCCEG